MPRARSGGHLVRIPASPAIAYDLTFFYPPDRDEFLLNKHVARLYREGKSDMGDSFMKHLREKKPLTVKQRLMLMIWEHPTDLRLRVIRSQLAKESESRSKWGTAFRRDPSDCYKQEKAAVQKAIDDLRQEEECLGKLEKILDAAS